MAGSAWDSRRDSVEYRKAQARLHEPEALARLVIAARARSGISQEELAGLVGVSLDAVVALESGVAELDDDRREQFGRVLRSLETAEIQRAVAASAI